VAGGWRKLQNEDLHDLYASPDVIGVIKSRRMRLAGHIAYIGEMRNAYKILIGRPEGKSPLVWPRRTWEDNIRLDLREIRWEVVKWIHLTQDRDQWRTLVNTERTIGFHKGVEFLDYLSDC